MNDMIVIDGENGVLGRIASFAAKKALQGHEIRIVNSEKIVITGNRAYIIENYLTLRRRNHVRFPSQPERIMKRTIRGMINYTSGRGAKALDNIKCYRGMPEELKNSEKIKFETKKRDLVDLSELCRMLKN